MAGSSKNMTATSRLCWRHLKKLASSLILKSVTSTRKACSSLGMSCQLKVCCQMRITLKLSQKLQRLATPLLYAHSWDSQHGMQSLCKIMHLCRDGTFDTEAPKPASLFWSRMARSAVPRLVSNLRDHVTDDVWSVIRHNEPLNWFEWFETLARIHSL